ncbi:family 78 glycoside hydrolase catalytic domain [Pedobacter metabolipauper]|uniref:alpha-L-rhamnosidase n=1 Tax=Pedobacter metabolipauper TaxID=425513 RepID=A0A4R6SS45_9SPHI|nr:family 78 glycoside hydrolase catalytic domain [Pedobacter metabolipauper]TDQ08107.1 F5/8 type C domain-containing protein [Pedobacter metabolipauper]
MLKKRNQVAPIMIVLFLAISSFAFGQGLRIEQSNCEYRVNPEGIDVISPRLSWVMASDLRGDKQTAFQIIVASNLNALKMNKGDIWDSGKQVSTENNRVYKGQKLLSGKQYYWKVRAWDSKNKVTPWSANAYWSMGLLTKKEWKAVWITDPVLADPNNFSLTPINCYRSLTTENQYQEKWIILDLGTEQAINAVNIIPARSVNQNIDFLSFMYPLRYKIQVSANKNFQNAKTIIDHTSADVLNPREANNIIAFQPVKTRYIRLLVTKLTRWDVNLYGLALGGFNAIYNKKVIEENVTADCSDAIESKQWSKKFLLKKENLITNIPDPIALAVGVKELSDIAPVNKVSRVPTLRREFSLAAKVKRANLFVTARGFYEFHINGKKVSDLYLSPGVTDYNKRITYQTFDVTQMLKPGGNAVGAMLGYGWYAGHMNLFENRNIYGHYPLLMAQLEIELENGKHITIATDKQWKTTLKGSLLWSDLLDGEAIDQRLALTGWDKTNFDDKDWSIAEAKQLDDTKLVGQRNQPVKEIRELKPVAVKKISKGVYVFDFGQEIAGWCRLVVAGKKDTHIRVRHAEILKKNGDIDMSNLWGIPQQEDYILNDDKTQTLTPHFTYHGFRYVQVSGLENEPDPNTITAISMHNNVPEAGEFESSNPLYNKLMETAIWTQRNLMFDMPNGCAARSERLGWTGDLRPCVQSLIYNMDAAAFLEKYAQDMRDDQTPDGRFTDIAPQFHLENTNICVGSPGWADAGVSMPWQVYVNYGDKRILEEHYPAAQRWVDFLSSKNPNFLWENNRGMDWGDWLSTGPATPRVLGSTAFFAHDADQLSKMAGVLGKKADELKYRQLFNQIKKAFMSSFVNQDGSITEAPGKADVQGSYALALYFDLLDEPIRSKAANRLAQMIGESKGHLTTGFWSSIETLLALSENKQHQSAVQVANTETQPSWGYMLKAGGTTYWESFDADRRNLSLNHWTYSSIGEWLWRYIAGLNVDENNPGYKHFTVKPHATSTNDSCKVAYQSINGAIKINWKRSVDKFTIEVTVPPGSTATVYIPSKGSNITESGLPISQSKGLKLVKQENNEAIMNIQSGTYYISTAL